MTKTRKRGLAIGIITAIFAALLFAAGSVSPMTAYADDVTYLSDANDLIALADFVNGVSEAGEDRRDCWGKMYVLTADISLDTTFGVIGKTSVFHGVIDGRGHSVTFALTGQSDRSALVGWLGSSGEVRNLVVRGSVSGNGVLGSVVAFNDGLVENCVSYVAFTNAGASSSATGGVVAANSTSGKVRSCAFLGSIQAKNNVGGIAGTSDGTLDSCVNLGALTAPAGGVTSNFGGVAGRSSGSMYDCFTHAAIRIESERNYVGSVVGQSGGARSGNNYAVSYDVVTDVLTPCGSDMTGDVAGKFERRSTYDFLCDEGVTFTGERYVRPRYDLGYGFLYAPAFLLDDEDAFVDESVAAAFRVPLFADGDGTEVSPFVVTDTEVWALFRTNTSLYDYQDRYVVIDADLNVGDAVALGEADVPFRGTFDGDGHTITYSYAAQGNDVGLFAYFAGTMRDLTLAGSLYGGERVGAFAANVVGESYFSTLTGRVTTYGKSCVGGIAGNVDTSATATFYACVNRAKVVCTGANGDGRTGGLLGYARGAVTMVDGYNYAEVQTDNNGTSAIGGVIGEAVGRAGCNMTIADVLNEGMISAAKSNYVGGLIGKVSSDGDPVEVSGAASIGTVYGKFDVGGIAGSASGATISDFSVIADVSGRSNVSGISGAEGALSLSTGLYTGRLTQSVTGSEFVADPVCCSEDNEPTTVKVYYSIDDGNGYGMYAVSKNVLELTSGELFEDPGMREDAPGDIRGYYPVPLALVERLSGESSRVVRYFEDKVHDEEEGADYYCIGSEQTLRNFAFLVGASETYVSAKYRLTSDITLTREYPEIALFKGTLVGNGYAIRGYERAFDSTKAGFFDQLVGAHIDGMVLLGNGRITATDPTAYVGSVCGEADEDTVIESSYSTLTVSGGDIAGGLVGENRGTIRTSFFAGKIADAANAGGIAGATAGTVEQCFNVGYVLGTDRVGGIAAFAENATVTACLVSGRLEGGASFAGGFAAIATGATVRNSVVLADFVVSNTAGALFGNADADTVAEIANLFYNKDFIGYLAYPGISTQDNEDHGKANEYFRLSGTGYFNVVGFDRIGDEYNDAFDAYESVCLTAFSPYLDTAAATYDARRAQYVKKAAEIFIFGRDTSSDRDPGSANNPYVIETATAFKMLYPLTRRTEYTNKYFYVPHDIDLGESGLYPGYAIGYYSAEGGNAFCGTIYGDAAHRPTISGVEVTVAGSDLGTTTSYLGVFANTETGFAARNLIFEGTVTGTDNVSGLVGYTHGGVIENCLSRIAVTATGEEATAGGLVAGASGSVTVTGSVFAGSLTAPTAYGVLGFRAQSGLTVDCRYSWYVVSGDAYETYAHNNFGSVLYVYADPGKGETFEVVSSASGFGFLTEAPVGYPYVGYLMDTTDVVVREIGAEAYYPPRDSVTYYYCVRFCATVEGTAVTTEDDVVFTPTAYATVTLASRYYVGQTVTAELGWTDDGKAIGYRYVRLMNEAYEDVGYAFAPSAEDVLVTFTMTTATRTIYILVERISDGDILQFDTASGAEYDGTAKDPTVLVGNAETAYNLTDGAAAEHLLDAGSYVVTVRVRDAGGYVVGTYREEYVIAKRTLTIGDAEALQAYCTTTYDRSTAKRNAILTVDADSTAILGVVGGDGVTVELEFTFASGNAGEGIGLSVTDASTTADNYRFAVTTKDLGAVGTIVKKALTVRPDGATYDEVEDAYFVYATYNKKAPTIDGTFEIAVSWKITDLTSGSAVTSGYEAGAYGLQPLPTDAADVDNYILSYGTLRLVIRPYVVGSALIVYSGTEFGYTGESLVTAANNAVTFTAPEIDSSAHAMTLTFYLDAQGSTEADGFVNAGIYYVKATPVDPNYTADENAPLTMLRIRKQTLMSAKLVFRKGDDVLTSGDTVYVEDRILVSYAEDDDVHTLGIDYDASMRVDSYNFTMDGEYIVPVAGGENVTFALECYNATNYENRTSESFTLTVRKKRIMAVLDRNEFTFGDRISESLTFSYYYFGAYEPTPEETAQAEEYLRAHTGKDAVAFRTVGEEIDKEAIAGLEEATIDLGTTEFHAGRYRITFSGGSSNGYEIGFYTEKHSDVPGLEGKLVAVAETDLIVNRKAVWVAVGNAGSKTYGDPDPEIPYSLTVRVSENVVAQLTELPDGTIPTLIGKLGRVAGEDVGEYSLTLGTLTTTNNPDYRIEGQNLTVSRFAINRRPISVTIADGQGKEYGMPDEKILLQCVEGEMVRNEALGIHDDISLLDAAIPVSREEGEDVGLYAYSVTYDRTEWYRLNYEVTYVGGAGKYYVIRRATPHVNFAVMGGVIYGGTTDAVTYIANAENAAGEDVPGTYELYVFDLETDKRYTFDLGDTSLIVVFSPENKNYNEVRFSREITVGKRPVTVTVIKAGTDASANGMTFTYTGKALPTDAFTVMVHNLSGDDATYSSVLSIEGNAKDVTSEGFVVSATFMSDRYEATAIRNATCRITPALVTVKVADGTINYGEKFDPSITYTGLVSGENKSVLTKQATVREIPTEPGYHALQAAGAEATNYTFTYVAGILTINRVGAASEDGSVRIDGQLPPEYAIRATVAKEGTDMFAATAEELDKNLGANVLVPYTHEMAEYVALSATKTVGEEMSYSVRFASFAATDKLVLLLADGKTVDVQEFETEADADGVTVRFTAEDVIGVARYQKKEMLDYLLGFKWLAAIGVGALLLLVLVIVLAVAARKRAARNQYVTVPAQMKAPLAGRRR